MKRKHSQIAIKSKWYKNLFTTVLAAAIFTTSAPWTLAASDGHSHKEASHLEKTLLGESEMPETIDEVITRIQDNFHKDPSSNHLDFIDDLHSADNTLEVLNKEQEKKYPPFVEQYLKEKKRFFVKESEYLGGSQDSKSMAFTLFSQWIYLEMYKIRRWEYLMINLAKILSQDESLTVSQTVEYFRKIIPFEELTEYPYLEGHHSSIVAKLAAQTEEERVDVREYVRGLTESNYLAIAAIEQKRKLTIKRYGKEDLKLKQALEELDKNLTYVQDSALLQTPVFKKKVAPYVVKEATVAELKIEGATNRYIKKLKEYLKKQRTAADLIGYTNGEEMVEFNKDLLSALSTPEAKRFRERIKDAYQEGIKHLRDNLEKVISEHRRDIMSFDTTTWVLKSNTSSKHNMQKYHKWLVKILTEGQIHNMITAQFPHIVHSAAEAFTDKATRELTRVRNKFWKDLSIALGIFTLAPLGRIGNRHSSWMGKKVVSFWRYIYLTSGAGYIGNQVYNRSLEYIEWQRTRRLAMTNLEGVGLTSMIAIEGAYKSFFYRSLIAGGAGLMMLHLTKGFWKQLPLVRRNKQGHITKAFKESWAGFPKKNGTWGVSNRPAVRLEAFKKSSAAAQRAISRKDWASASKYLQKMSTYAGGIAAQTMVMPLAALPAGLRGFLGSLPKRAIDGAIYAIVMGVMAYTVSIYAVAAGVDVFVWAFKKLGLQAPAFWQLNSLDKNQWLKREAFAEYARILSEARFRISDLHWRIAESKHKLRTNKNLTAEERAEYETIVKESQVAIDAILECHLILWYHYFETRHIRSSFFKHIGFGVLVEPDIKNPVRLTFLLERVKGDPSTAILFSTSVHRLDDAFKRTKVKPHLGLSKSELKALAERLEQGILDEGHEGHNGDSKSHLPSAEKEVF